MSWLEADCDAQNLTPWVVGGLRRLIPLNATMVVSTAARFCPELGMKGVVISLDRPFLFFRIDRRDNLEDENGSHRCGKSPSQDQASQWRLSPSKHRLDEATASRALYRWSP